MEGRDRQCCRGRGSVPAGLWTECHPGAPLLSGCCPGNQASPLSLIELAFPSIRWSMTRAFRRRQMAVSPRRWMTGHVELGQRGTHALSLSMLADRAAKRSPVHSLNWGYLARCMPTRTCRYSAFSSNFRDHQTGWLRLLAEAGSTVGRCYGGDVQGRSSLPVLLRRAWFTRSSAGFERLSSGEIGRAHV